MNDFNSIPPWVNDLIADYLLGTIDRAGMIRLIYWVQSSDFNKRIFNQFNDIWQALASDRVFEDTDVQKEWQEVLERIHQKRFRLKAGMDGRPKYLPLIWWTLGIAAAFAVVFGAGVFFRDYWLSENTRQPVAEYVEMVAPLGSRAFVVLSDGSEVWLNAGTRLRYDTRFGVSDRNLYLEGEAYFNVAKRSDMPFVVNAADVKIIALGTVFNVKAYSEERRVETTLESGTVKIERSGDKVTKKQGIVLQPNQKASLVVTHPANGDTSQPDKHKQLVDSVELYALAAGKPEAVVEKMDDIRVSTSWKDSRWLVRGESLESLAVKLSRRYDVSFVFKDEALKQYRFSTTLRDETLEQVLNMVRVSAPIRYVIKEKIVYLSMNPKYKETFEESIQ